MRNSKYIIQISKLTKIYPNNLRAISNLTLNVPRGVFGLLGPNGSGKTTLIEVLVGAIKPTSGGVDILGHNIARDSIYIKRQIGYLPENPGIYKDISGLRFLQYMGQLSGLDRVKAKKRAKGLLTQVGLNEWEDQKTKTYSAGMRQRLAFAASLINDPEILFLDEPTSALDPIERENMLNTIKQISNSGKNIFLSTHLLLEIEQIADYVAIISNGSLMIQGEVRELTKKGNLLSVYRDVLVKKGE